ncbi:MAG: hypothetical protein ABR979_01725 [Halobacteriota archaeon]|jgi:hypothetical protein
MKRIKTALALGILAALVVSVAGCTTTNNTTQTTPSAAPTAATQHDAFLEKFLTTYKNMAYSNSNLSIKAWELDWINSTSAHLHWTTIVKPSNYTWNYDFTYTVFPTSQDATQYINTVNKTAYSLASTKNPGGPYQNVTGHAPQIYKQYLYNEGNPSNISEYRLHEILQLDNIVVVTTAKILYTA